MPSDHSDRRWMHQCLENLSRFYVEDPHLRALRIGYGEPFVLGIEYQKPRQSWLR